MIKFFRKHNNKMLMIFMSLLLVVWLGAEALQALFSPDPGATVAATTASGEIRQADMSRVNRLDQLLTRLGIDIQRPGGGVSQAEQVTNYDWIMLSREAKRAGFATRPDEAANFLNSMGWDANFLHQVANNEGITLERLYAGVAEFIDVRKAIERIAQGAMLSEAEIRAKARDQYEQVTAAMATFKASAFVDPEATFTDSQIQEQFEKYRDQQAGTGLNFGYFMPPKVKIQYCKIDFEAVLANLQADEQKLYREARAYWKANSETPEFQRPVGGAELPPGLGADSPYYTWDEAKSKAIESARQLEVEQKADRIAEGILQLAMDPWLDAAEGDDRYRKLPAGVDDPEVYERYAAEAVGEGSTEKVVTVATTDWRSAKELPEAPGIGAATIPSAQGAMTGIASVAFGVQGLVEIPEDTTERMDVLTQHETYRAILRDTDKNRYVFRVVGVQKAHAPESVDEVKEQVIADLRTAQAFEVAKVKGQELAQEAKKFGLENAWSSATELTEKVGTEHGGFNASVRISRSTSLVPGLGMAGEDFKDQVFALGDWSKNQEQWASIPVPDQAAVAVVEWKELNPLVKSSYANQRQMIASLNQYMRRQQILTQWLDPKNIRERNKFEFVR